MRSSILAAMTLAASVTSAQGSPQYTSVFGGSGGTAFTRDCGAGRVMTGLRGRSGAYVDAVGLLCAPVRSDGTLGSTSAVGELAGGGGGTFAELRCASGQVVSNIAIGYGSVVDHLAVYCRLWNAAARRFEGDFAVVGNLGVYRTGSQHVAATCSARVQPGAGIRGRRGMLVDAIGLICDEP
jgi:hypothetical protein